MITGHIGYKSLVCPIFFAIFVKMWKLDYKCVILILPLLY